MKLKFKQQSFQNDAANAVCDVFIGQPYSSVNFVTDVDPVSQNNANIGYGNEIIKLDDKLILSNIRKVQNANQIELSDDVLHCDASNYNLTIEMETGVGKTYTYIKTIYELNKRYGWSKFIVVVPSVAIREGVYSSFSSMKDHFYEQYGKSINYFIYNSNKLDDIKHYVLNDIISVMIINSQAFNSTKSDARKIDMELDSFNSRKPISVLADSHPIMIIDEPQSVEGAKTKASLKKFNPLMILRYSATHKKDSIYNMVYRLDAIDACNKKLVKKISVKGIGITGNNAVSGYIYLSSINCSVDKNPTATLEFDYKNSSSTKKVTREVNEGYNLYENSKELEEYKGITVTRIDKTTDSVEFSNGLVLSVGEMTNKAVESDFRRVQIQETIKSHFDKEAILFEKGIKTLSLFFIDEVSKYRSSNDSSSQSKGEYAKIFEEEYESYKNKLLKNASVNQNYKKYLEAIDVSKTHAGYFSVDKKGSFINSKETSRDGGESDVNTYDLIMKDKEKLLDLDPYTSPVRFIFSHSALREGWDNPNVFQICTLKNANSEIRKRQEVGRGLRLCVNKDGVRMDTSVLGDDVQNINNLTVIASESYENFVKALQKDIADSVTSRPLKISSDLFKNQSCERNDGSKDVISSDVADSIMMELVSSGYVDKKTKQITEKCHNDLKSGNFKLSDDELNNYLPGIKNIISKAFDGYALLPENVRKNNVDAKIEHKNFDKREFQSLWSKINQKTRYLVDFDSNELVKNAIEAINKELVVSQVYFNITEGEATSYTSKESLLSGSDFKVKSTKEERVVKSVIPPSLKFDLIGKIVSTTGLTRKDISSILRGISSEKFAMYKQNPEEFILRVSNIVNEQKSVSVVNHIKYETLGSTYESDIFTDSSLKGRLNVNAMNSNKHIYTHVIYDSDNEKKFAEDLECHEEVIVYAKLPKGFYINTPVGHYNPDWAVVFNDKVNKVKDIYFVAETKGCNDTLNLRAIEKAKIDCAKVHFDAICNGLIGDEKVNYCQVKDYGTLLEILRNKKNRA